MVSDLSFSVSVGLSFSSLSVSVGLSFSSLSLFLADVLSLNGEESDKEVVNVNAEDVAVNAAPVANADTTPMEDDVQADKEDNDDSGSDSILIETMRLFEGPCFLVPATIYETLLKEGTRVRICQADTVFGFIDDMEMVNGSLYVFNKVDDWNALAFFLHRCHTLVLHNMVILPGFLSYPLLRHVEELQLHRSEVHVSLQALSNIKLIEVYRNGSLHLEGRGMLHYDFDHVSNNGRVHFHPREICNLFNPAHVVGRMTRKTSPASPPSIVQVVAPASHRPRS